MSPSRRYPSRQATRFSRERRLKLERLEDRRLLSSDWVRSIDGAGNNESQRELGRGQHAFVEVDRGGVRPGV